MRLIRRSVGIDDEVEAGVVDLQAAQPNAGTEKIAQAQNHAQVIDFCVGRFAGIFKTVNHDAVGFGFKMKQAPVEGCNLSPAAGEFFNRRNEALAHHIFKRGRAGHEIEADGQKRQEDRRECNGERKMAQEEAAQTAAHAAVRTLRLGKLFAGNRLVVCSLIGSPLPRRSGWLAFPLPALVAERLRDQIPGQVRVEHFHIALLAQIGEPVVEQHVHLLLQQDLLNARSHLVQRRNGFAGRVLRQQRVVVVECQFAAERFECPAGIAAR